MADKRELPVVRPQKIIVQMISTSLANNVYICSVKRMLCARVCAQSVPTAKPFAEKSGKLKNSGWGKQADVSAYRRESFALVYLHRYFQTPSAGTSEYKNEFTPMWRFVWMSVAEGCENSCQLT